MSIIQKINNGGTVSITLNKEENIVSFGDHYYPWNDVDLNKSEILLLSEELKNFADTIEDNPKIIAENIQWKIEKKSIKSIN